MTLPTEWQLVIFGLGAFVAGLFFTRCEVGYWKEEARWWKGMAEGWRDCAKGWQRRCEEVKRDEHDANNHTGADDWAGCGLAGAGGSSVAGLGANQTGDADCDWTRPYSGVLWIDGRR